MKRTSILAATAVILMILVGLWVSQRYWPGAALEARQQTQSDSFEQEGFNHDLPAASVDEDALGALATASCQCARSGSESQAAKVECWRDYEAATAELETFGIASACAPVSTELECVATDEGEKCWVVGYGYDEVCTAEDARGVENAWHSAYSEEGQLRSASPYDAVNKVLARLRRGEEIATPSTGGGCATD